MKFYLIYGIIAIICAARVSRAQIQSFPFTESFDAVVAPAVPLDWAVQGFAVSTSTSRSSPNCISTTGNTTAKSIVSPGFDFTHRVPDKLIFWERRSATASAYRFEVRAALNDTDFSILIARFDTITSTSSYIQRIIDFKESGLQLNSHVRLQWLLLGDNTNSTGVLRIDDVSLTVSIGSDIGLTALTISPRSPVRNDSLTISTTVKNYGVFAASNITLRFFKDENSDEAAETGEQFSLQSGISLNSGDSLACSTNFSSVSAGEHCFIVTAESHLDENRSNDTLHSKIYARYLQGDLLVNEIMYAPMGDEPEWVELFNNSPDSINLKGWKISDNNISTKSFITQSDVQVAPNTYVVVAKDLNFSLVHPNVFSVIAYFSALNNTTSDAVILYDPSNVTMDSVLYEPGWGGQNGKSLERIACELSGTISTNWGTCQDSLSSTPGIVNSIARLNYDIALTNVTQTRIESGGKIVPSIQFTVHNVGRNAVDSMQLKLFLQHNNTAVGDSAELIQCTSILRTLFPGDSIQWSERLSEVHSGESAIIVVVEYWRDERKKNNRALISIRNGFEPQSVILNEIMYEPLNSQNEWFELYNRSNVPIDIAHWSFQDRATANGINSFVISDSSLVIPPGGFIVVAADSSLCELFSYLKTRPANVHVSILHRSGGFSFNNDGDAIVLKDLVGQTIDSVLYSPRWHHPDLLDTYGRSLERINPLFATNDRKSWSTSTNMLGGTPGQANSIMATSPVIGSTLSISPNPFSPDGDGYEDFCVIQAHLSLKTSNMNIRIYDIKGRLIRTLVNGEIGGLINNFVWDGRGDDNQRVRVGVYIVFLEATEQSTGAVETAKTVAVVATQF